MSQRRSSLKISFFSAFGNLLLSSTCDNHAYSPFLSFPFSLYLLTCLGKSTVFRRGQPGSVEHTESFYFSPCSVYVFSFWFNERFMYTYIRRLRGNMRRDVLAWLLWCHFLLSYTYFSVSGIFCSLKLLLEVSTYIATVWMKRVRTCRLHFSVFACVSRPTLP